MTDIRALLKRLANRADRSNDDERGFSLIELIIVIVILGILVAIAIPVYNNIQKQAKDNANKTAASNGASQATAFLANPGSVPDPAAAAATALQKLSKDGITVAFKTTPVPDNGGSDVCVTADDGAGGGDPATAGPGC